MSALASLSELYTLAITHTAGCPIPLHSDGGRYLFGGKLEVVLGVEGGAPLLLPGVVFPGQPAHLGGEEGPRAQDHLKREETGCIIIPVSSCTPDGRRCKKWNLGSYMHAPQWH